MAESTTTQETGGQAPQADGTATAAFRPITTQEDFDKAFSRRWAQEKSRYDGFEGYKAKAAEYDKAQDAAKSELQRMQERAEAAEEKASAFEKKEQIAAWTKEVAKASGVPADALRGSTKEEVEAHAETLKPHLARAAAPVVPGDGDAAGTTGTGTDPIREIFKR